MIPALFSYMLATQFETSQARTVFPGWDEPGYKATFSISVVYPSAHVVLSNMLETTPLQLEYCICLL